ncbi:actin-like ATPase domain-containing protein [Apiospora aurea]|uniref:Actin-like ATPase domain-containing protein n=1 Tax=Apiospora aurea TaxID=335848 RepID=A0ABR1Q7D0_9PEZI
MASDPDARPTLAHRSVSNIRAGGQPSARDSTSGAPHTPLRPLSTSAFGSPSSARAEEEIIVIELGCRKLRVGFAGDSTPKRIVAFDSEHDKRAGDYRAWEPGYGHDWRKRMAGKAWGSDHELYQLDVRGQDLGLVGDKLERVLRDTFTRYLLVDSKARRISLVLPPAAPLPLLSSTLSTLFRNFQIPTISLLSSPVMATFAAGVRSGFVVDIGWNETIVTAVYEFREVRTWRTVRAGKKLLEETQKFLVNALQCRTAESQVEEAPTPKDIISFEECEEVATRMLWCKKSEKTPKQSNTEGLPTLHEADESDTPYPAEDSTPTPIHLTSCNPSKTIEVPFSQLAEPCETTFFETRYAPACFDDHELPLHLLIYRGLLQLPLDVRAMCMSRIIFSGGCSNIIGLRGRIFDEVSLLAQEKGWEVIQGKGADAYRKNPKLKRNASRQTNDGPIPTISQTDPSGASGEEAVPLDPAHAPADVDEVEEHIRQEKNYRTPVQGVLRVIDTLGPWCGASMATQLKVPALAMIERDIWLQQGVNGASRPNEVDVQAQQKQQRQSMGTGGLIRGQGNQATSWTLGVWGTV